jgi:hypothetical protein
MCHLGRKKLEGDGAMQSGVFGFVNYAHAAPAESFENAVV